MKNKSSFRKFFDFRSFSNHLGTLDVPRNTTQLRSRFSQMMANYLQQVSQDPKTNRPSHYNEQSQFDPNNYYRKRSPSELDDPTVSPYQHHHYDPPNDKSTELYNNFRDSSHSNSTVALREHAPRPFVPGAANPYLKHHARLYSNHYIRVGAETATVDIGQVYILYCYLLLGFFIEMCPTWYHYVSPEYGGTPSWSG